MNDTSAETILEDMIKTYEETYQRETGETITLKPADQVRIELYTLALMFYQERKLIEYKQKQNLLEYAEGEMLDGLAKWFHLTRLPAQKARTTMKITLTTILSSAEVIQKGTRFSTGTDLFFETTEQAVIPIGAQTVEVEAEAMTEGEAANGLLPGQINVLVDPLPYVYSVENTEKTQGGAEVETDEKLRERIELFWTGYSVAGPEEAYIYHTKSYNQNIEDVVVESEIPGEVNVYLILKDGEMPEEGFLGGIESHLEGYRPLTDKVLIQKPQEVEYSINLTYYLESGQEKNAEKVKEAIQAAIEDFIYNLKTKIGRNINPDDLIALCKEAGASRLEIRSPVYTKIGGSSIAKLKDKTVIFGGIEDD